MSKFVLNISLLNFCKMPEFVKHPPSPHKKKKKFMLIIMYHELVVVIKGNRSTKIFYSE